MNERFHFMTPFALIFLVLNFGCSHKLKPQEQLPFKIDSAYYQNWSGGFQGAGTGYNLFLKLSDKLPENIKLTKIYFKNKEATFETKPQDSLLYIAYFKNDLNARDELIMHGDITKEYGNKPPVTVSSKHKIEPGQALLFYTENGIEKSYLIENVSEQQTQQYPKIRKPNR
jgi:hypothetical protein